MAAYLIGDVQVLDNAGFEEYRQKVPAVIAMYGGRYLARGRPIEVLEGAFTPHRGVVLEFPSMAQLKTWWESPEYRPLRALRERTAISILFAIDGA